MAFEFITENDLITTFDDAKKFMLPLHEPLDEYERIARNRPHPGIDKSLPKVTDGTLAAQIQDQPMRVVQQIPSGSLVKCDDWMKIVGNFILENEILPNSEQTATLIEKCWALIEKSKTYGAQPAYVQFVQRGDYFGTDWSLPYVKDVLLEPGKLSDRDSNVMFLRTWWSKGQIDQIIYKEKMLAKRAKARGEDYEGTWNLTALELLKNEEAAKDPASQTAKERETSEGTGFIEIVHCFQRGVGARFFSFSPKLPAGENVVRTKVNPDPRGEIPIHFMYSKIDFSNPLGRGAVELGGGMQNLLDSEVQMFQYNRALLLNPPMIKRGEWSSAQAKYKPNALIDLGTDANAEFKPLDVDNSSIQRFPENYGLMRSQILNLFSGGGDTSTSSTVGNPGFSKTDAGIDALQERLGFSDNYTRKKFEGTFQEILETCLNLYFAERKGIQELQLDDETADKLRKIEPKAVNAQNKIRINYDEETPKLKFKIDASSSMKKDNTEQVEKGKEILELVGTFPYLDKKSGGPADTTELLDRIVRAVGLEDPEKIIIKPEVDENGQPVNQEQPENELTPDMVMQMIQEAIQQAKIKPQEDPRVTIIKTLGGDNIPEATRNAILESLDLPVDGLSNKDKELHIKAADVENKDEANKRTGAIQVADMGQREEDAKATRRITASDAALRVAQATHGERTGERDFRFKASEAKENRKQQAKMNKQPKPIKQGAEK